jgi:transposase
MKRRYIGVDLHKNSFTVCYLKESGEQDIKTFKVTQEEIELFKKSLNRTDLLAVEATGNAGYFVRQIGNAVKESKVINPGQFKIISASVKKTDENDAAIIAKYLSKGLLPEARVKTKEQAQTASLIGTRTKLVQLRTALKNKIHNILNVNGIVTKRESLSSEKGLNAVLENNVDPDCLFELRIIVDQIRSLNKAIAEIDVKISDRSKDLTGYKNITSISGIGATSAAVLLSAIGDINDFENDGKLAAYVGIVPRVHISNTTSHYGRITKMGNKAARTALVQSTLIAIKYNHYLKAFYLRLKEKKGSGKAIIATARKLLTIIYRTLKNNWVFEDFNAFKLAPAI